MLPGECLCSGPSSPCPDCDIVLALTVLQSNAGYYIGTSCNCGPYSRESGYFRTHDEAKKALDYGGWTDRADNAR